MYVVLIDYVRPLVEVDRLLDRHAGYLERNFRAGRFLASGRRVPRTGGVILARDTDIDDIETVVSTDPLLTEGVATHNVIEFEASRTAECLAQ